MHAGRDTDSVVASLVVHHSQLDEDILQRVVLRLPRTTRRLAVEIGVGPEILLEVPAPFFALRHVVEHAVPPADLRR